MVSTSVYAVLDLQLSQNRSEMYNRFVIAITKTEIHFSTDPSLLVIKLELKQKHKIRTRNITKTKSKAHEPN